MATGPIGFPLESGPDRRTLLTPIVARHLTAAGFHVLAQAGIGAAIFLDDAVLAAEGVHFASADEVWAAPLLLRYKSTQPDEVRLLRSGQVIGAQLHTEGNPEMLAALTTSGATAYCYEYVEQDGQFPLAAPGGQITGIQAVLTGAHTMLAAAGRSIRLARAPGTARRRVVVIGCCTVSAVAARTAVFLGADVTMLAHAVHTTALQQRVAHAGIRVLANTTANRQRELAQADLVVGAFLIPTHNTYPMITETDLLVMKPEAVIVDATYGPVHRPGRPPHALHSVPNVDIDILPALVPLTLTIAYASTIAPYLVRLAEVVLRDAVDPVIETARIAADGELVHPGCRPHAELHRIPT